jgi:L-threonylcarbamoyladenylate synthase
MRIVAPSEIDLAAQAVEAGRLVIVPTSRWYMICCDASNTDACDRIFAAKQRPADKSLLPRPRTRCGNGFTSARTPSW